MSGRFPVRVRRDRGDPRSPYLVAEEIAVAHPLTFREGGRLGRLAPWLESTGRRDRRRLEIKVLKGTTARGAETSRRRDAARRRRARPG